MVLVDLGQYATSFGAQVVLSLLIALVALGVAYAARRARLALAERFAPVTVDVIGTAVSIGAVALAVVAIADVWGQAGFLAEQFGALQLEDRAPQIAVTIVVLIGAQVLTSVARRLLDDITRESDAMSEHEREISYRVTQLLVWIVAAIVVLGIFRVDLGGLLIGAGFLGIVMGLAAQQTLGSLIAGFMLMFSRPFEVGDWIAIGRGPDEHEGVVTDITLMNTRIQAFDGEFVVVPNDVISSRTVRNRSRKGRLRIEVEVGVDYSADVERARELATEAVAAVDMVMDVPRPECVTKSFDDSAVTLAARGWIEHPSSRRRWRATTRMVAAIKDRFAEEGIKIPFPQRELSGREEHGGFRVADGELRDGARVPPESPVDERGGSGEAGQRPDEPAGPSEVRPDGSRRRSGDDPPEPASDEPREPAGDGAGGDDE